MGSTNRKAERLQIEELKRLNWMNSFDEEPVPELKSEAIDFRVVRSIQEVDNPRMEHFAHHYGTSGPSGANHRRFASVRQGQVRSISGWSATPIVEA